MFPLKTVVPVGFPWGTGVKCDVVRGALSSDHTHDLMPPSTSTSHARKTCQMSF